MGKRYVGAIVLSINGWDVECKSFKPSRKYGRKVVKTMNREGVSKGYTESGVAEYTFSITAPVQPTGLDINWDNITNATLSIYDRKGGLFEQYFGCFTDEVSESYEVENEATHDVSMGALRFFRATPNLF